MTFAKWRTILVFFLPLDTLEVEIVGRTVDIFFTLQFLILSQTSKKNEK